MVYTESYTVSFDEMNKGFKTLFPIRQILTITVNSLEYDFTGIRNLKIPILAFGDNVEITYETEDK